MSRKKNAAGAETPHRHTDRKAQHWQMRKLGTVEKIFAYGKCGFLCTTLGEHYYFSRQSFAANPRRLKIGELVFFDDAVRNGKPVAENIDADTLQQKP